MWQSHHHISPLPPCLQCPRCLFHRPQCPQGGPPWSACGQKGLAKRFTPPLGGIGTRGQRGRRSCVALVPGRSNPRRQSCVDSSTPLHDIPSTPRTRLEPVLLSMSLNSFLFPLGFEHLLNVGRSMWSASVPFSNGSCRESSASGRASGALPTPLRVKTHAGGHFLQAPNAPN